MRTVPSRMRGMGATGWVVALVIGAVLATAVVQIVPVYLEYNTVRGAITNVIDDRQSRMQSEREIRDAISRRFQVNNVDTISANDLEISKGGGEVTVTVEYEVRRSLIGNIDLVISFDREFTRDIR